MTNKGIYKIMSCHCLKCRENTESKKSKGCKD